MTDFETHPIGTQKRLDAMEWQDISTAPKDGTRVLLVCMMASKETKSRQGQMAVDFWHTSKKHGYDGWGLFNHGYFPATHWMPLPQPPRETTP